MSLKSVAQSVREKLTQLVFPQSCIYCEGDRRGGGSFLCLACEEDILCIDGPVCGVCGAPAEMSYDYPRENFECGACRRRPCHFDRARSWGRYDAVLKKLMHFYKYRPQRGAVSELESLMRRSMPYDGATLENFHIVSVPLHKNKLKERQFDQAFLIARALAHYYGLPLANEWVVKIRDTASQAKKNRTERMKNVRGAFQALDGDAIKGRNILLVDDVYTTGATVNEVAKTLKSAGCASVYVFTLARA
ncbi:MAG: ComF family protein [Candidatus Nitrohelix vancouverensis]|uniref:ComF family protein n=1 Tax=Candidatus Nitrohelix vancouverensis TaxID=2705534 RepID=A0A7T0G4N1_9BACT|nr:MAG: ComF family protein [Candidatus Nitrohelix vancouverensis]